MKNLNIFVAGHKGMVGSALMRVLKKKKVNIITVDKKKLNLLNQTNVKNFFKYKKIDQVYLAAARVGGIYANNTFPANFIYENTMIQVNVIHSAFLSGVKKLLFFGSTCIYPKYAKQPMTENDLLSGKLEPTNEPYAIAKILGIKICESYNRQYGNSHGIDYRSIMPTNLYGPGDNYHSQNSHVIPALLAKLHKAKMNKIQRIFVWGTGNARREFLHVDDLALAAVHVMNLNKKIYDKHTYPTISHINVGSGSDTTIKDLAYLIKDIVGYKGQIKFDDNKPDGNPRKSISSKIINKLGWKPKVKLKNGLLKTYRDLLKNNENFQKII